MKALNDNHEKQESNRDEMNLHKPKLEGKKQKDSTIQSLNVNESNKRKLQLY